jgi:chromosome segregation ATPase
VFGDVHMLSHLVGAANRADIRRLRELQQDNAALASKIGRQQRQLHQGFAERDAKISRLNELLAEQAGKLSKLPTSTQRNGDDSLILVVDQLKTGLARETARRERSELRVTELTSKIDETERALQTSRHECAAIREELDIIERHLTELGKPRADAAVELSGLTVLYVGGRAHQIPRMKELIENSGGCFLHHDGN